MKFTLRAPCAILIACFFAAAMAAQRVGSPDPKSSPVPSGHEPMSSFRADYRPLTSHDWIQDKNFYVLTLIQQIPELRSELNAFLKGTAIGPARVPDVSATDFPTTVSAMTLSEVTIEQVRLALVASVSQSAVLQRLVLDHLRPSGCYVRLANRIDADMLGEAWRQAAHGINHIIHEYALGLELRYPDIDSPSYDVHSAGYQKRVLRAVQTSIDDARKKSPSLVFEPSLYFALNLMVINHRDEVGRWEPLAQGENRATLEAIKHIDWKHYRCTAILLHGVGPEAPGLAISEASRANCEVAAKLYRDGLAPIIIPSGGYIHPQQTSFCEAIEMKRELITVYDIPESAILIEPQSRHTTTNVRNVARLVFASGLPTDKPCVSVSNKKHIDYMMSDAFGQRCVKELGYLPGKYMERINDNAAAFLPNIESLQIDPSDPLDP